MNYQLKDILDSVMNICQPFDEELNLGMSTKEIMRMDLLKYLLYLSTADNNISSQEVTILRDYLEWDMTAAQWGEFVTQNNLSGDNFISNIPISLQIFVRIDNEMYQKDSSTSDICNLYKYVFDELGRVIVAADGEIDNNEKVRLNESVI